LVLKIKPETGLLPPEMYFGYSSTHKKIGSNFISIIKASLIDQNEILPNISLFLVIKKVQPNVGIKPLL
jgi:hypothetical protein